MGDFISVASYRNQRKEWFKRGIELSKNRRVLLGPHASLGFQCRDLVRLVGGVDVLLVTRGSQVWIQIQESLLAEPGTSIEEELRAYNPLIPNGSNLVFTLFFEIENPTVRDRLLREYAGVEGSIALVLGESGKRIMSKPIDEDQEISRISKDGKTSAVHFLEFPLSSAEANSCRGPVQIVSTHPKYMHAATLSNETWQTIKKDLD